MIARVILPHFATMRQGKEERLITLRWSSCSFRGRFLPVMEMLRSKVVIESGTVTSTRYLTDPPITSSGSISLIVGPLNWSVLCSTRSASLMSARSRKTVSGETTILTIGLLISAVPLFRTKNISLDHFLVPSRRNSIGGTSLR